MDNQPGLRLRTSDELRQSARAQLRGKWLGAAAAVFAAYVVPGFFPLVSLIAGGPLKAGCTSYFLRIARGGAPEIKSLFSGFGDFFRNFCLFFLVNLYTFLWSLLLVIPGVVKGLSYAMAWYIRHDAPHLSASQAIEASMEMMRGHKMRLFYLLLSFAGWALLSVLVVFLSGSFSMLFLPEAAPLFVFVGILLSLFVYAYIEAAAALFYQDLKEYRTAGTFGADYSYGA